MAARNEYRHRRRTKAAIIIQACPLCLKTIQNTNLCKLNTEVIYVANFSLRLIFLYNGLQTQWRLHKAYLAYKQQKKATLALQCLWRARLARKELRKLRMVYRRTKIVL